MTGKHCSDINYGQNAPNYRAYDWPCGDWTTDSGFGFDQFSITILMLKRMVGILDFIFILHHITIQGFAAVSSGNKIW